MKKSLTILLLLVLCIGKGYSAITATQTELDVDNKPITNVETPAYSTSSLTGINCKYFFDNIPNIAQEVLTPLIIVGTTTVETSNSDYEELGLSANVTVSNYGTYVTTFKVYTEASVAGTLASFEIRRSTSSDMSGYTARDNLYMNLTSINTRYDRTVTNYQVFYPADIGTTFYYRVYWKTNKGTIINETTGEEEARKAVSIFYKNQINVSYED